MFRGEKSSDWIFSSSSIRAIFFMDFIFLVSGSTEPEGLSAGGKNRCLAVGVSIILIFMG